MKCKNICSPAPVERHRGVGEGPGVGLVSAEAQLAGGALLGQPGAELGPHSLLLPLHVTLAVTARVEGARVLSTRVPAVLCTDSEEER